MTSFILRLQIIYSKLRFWRSNIKKSYTPHHGSHSLLLPFLQTPPLHSLYHQFSHLFSSSLSKPITHFLCTIRSAISHTKKEETVKTHLENCYLLAGIRYTSFTIKQFQDLRRSLPESTKLIVAKNTIVLKAIEGTGWEPFKSCTKGINSWLFVHTKEIPTALKPYRDFQKERKLEGNDFTSVVFEGKYYGVEDFKVLETMPTRAEIYVKMLGALQGPTMGLVGTLQASAMDVMMG